MLTISAQTKLDKVVVRFNKKSIPYIYSNAILKTDDWLFLDARKKEEYTISHLKNAVWVGYKNFDAVTVLNAIRDINKPIVVYCSIGIRSENIGEKLTAMGFINVKNLYGGIFEWKNNGKPVYNSKEKETDSVHTFNKYWGRLLHSGIKVNN